MQKKGWVRIVEAFFSLLLIAGVLLIVINKGYIGGQDISAKVYDLQLAVLREIELDDNLRTAVLCAPDTSSTCGGFLPENGLEDDEQGFPSEITNKINERMPESFICQSKICNINSICELNKYVDADVYANKVAITATLEEYDPRQLKMFCWSD